MSSIHNNSDLLPCSYLDPLNAISARPHFTLPYDYDPFANPNPAFRQKPRYKVMTVANLRKELKVSYSVMTKAVAVVLGRKAYNTSIEDIHNIREYILRRQS